tara:strand:- start:340 stop:510 length:171 start_codon:yes stop_codon:yes gene_type:complete
LKHVGKLFKIEDARDLDLFGLILEVFTDSENILYKVLSDGDIWEIDLSEYSIKLYD